MPIYQIEAPDGNTLEFEGPEGASREDIIAYAQQMYKPEKPKAEEAPKTSAAKALLHGLERGALPTLAGFVTGAAGATAGTPLGLPGIIGGGLAAGFAGSAAVSEAQEAFLKAHPEVAKFLGLDEATAALEIGRAHV